MKKIIYIANARIPTEKAHGNTIMKMCEAFAKVGNEVELMIPRRFNTLKKDPYEYYSVEKNFKITKMFSLDFVHFGKIGFYAQVFSFSIFATLYTLFKKVDIIYSRDELPLYFLSFFKKNLVWEIHTAKKNFVIKRVSKKAKKIICITYGLKNFYIDNFGINYNKILVAPSAIDLEKFNIKETKEKLREMFSLPMGKKIIGYVGKYKTMGEGKGVKELVESFTELLKIHKNIFLLLVGINENELGELEKIINKNGIKNKENYKIVTHILPEEVPRYLKATDVLVMNYPNTEHYAKYMSPVKMFEYMASMTPVISTNLPSVVEILSKKNSVLVEPNNPTELANGIKKVLRNLGFADNISEQSYRDVQNYTWDKRVEIVLDFIS